MKDELDILYKKVLLKEENKECLITGVYKDPRVQDGYMQYLLAPLDEKNTLLSSWYLRSSFELLGDISKEEIEKDHEVKYMDIKEFQEKGYLQEVNRQFLHTLGLALTIIINDKDESYSITGIQDFRDDIEGISFGLKDSKDEARLERFYNKAKFIKAEKFEKSLDRGYNIEEIPEMDISK